MTGNRQAPCAKKKRVIFQLLFMASCEKNRAATVPAARRANGFLF
jgi:hypothetical protein